MENKIDHDPPAARPGAAAQQDDLTDPGTSLLQALLPLLESADEPTDPGIPPHLGPPGMSAGAGGPQAAASPEGDRGRVQALPAGEPFGQANLEPVSDPWGRASLLPVEDGDPVALTHEPAPLRAVALPPRPAGVPPVDVPLPAGAPPRLAHPPSLGMQVTLQMADLAVSTLDTSRDTSRHAHLMPRLASDLEDPEALAPRRSMLAGSMPNAPATVPAPVVAQVAADLFRLQTARLDQLMASRAPDDDGELPPADAEEAQRRNRMVQGVDLGSMWRWDLTPRAGALPEAPGAAAAVFRAALMTVAMQSPASVLAMFAAMNVQECVRVFALPAPPVWQPMPAGPTWLDRAAAACVAVHGAAPAVTALQAVLGAPCDSLTVVGDAASAKILWKTLCRANRPRQTPMLACDQDLRVYGVLGTFVREDVWMVSLCDAQTNGAEVISAPFAWVRRNVQQLALLCE